MPIAKAEPYSQTTSADCNLGYSSRSPATVKRHLFEESFHFYIWTLMVSASMSPKISSSSRQTYQKLQKKI
jgi:hypothetical protein